MARPQRTRTSRRRTPRRLILPFLVLGLIISADQGYAAFTATTANSGNTFTAAASFPTYPAAVTGDGAALLHRSDENPSSSATSTAADAAGTSQPGTYNGRTNGPSTHWEFDENAGATAADSSGAANPGVLVNPTWTTGRNGAALGFTGSQYAAGAGPAVTTSTSFTVSAWAYLSDDTAYRTVVSQDGVTVSGFVLHYHDGLNRWCMNMMSNDADAGAVDVACSTAAPALNAWTHLAGVFDSSAGNIRLYVNGVLQATTAHATAWNATGSLIAGASKFSGTRRDHFNGRIDEVRTYRRALSAAEITDLYADNPSLAYDFEENTGTSTADLSGNANTGTLGAGAAWTAAGKYGNATQFGVSATDYIASASAPIDTTTSFTVAAWVNLNTSGAVTRTVMSQQGTNYSTFILKYESTGEWAFLMTTNSTGTQDQALTSLGAAYNTWVHLVAVHDTAAAAGSKMRLYVNNALAASSPHATLYGAANPLQISRSRYAGGWVDPWDGEIDEVRAYRRALTTTEIATLYNGVDTATPAPMTAGVPGALQGVQQGQRSSTAVAFNGTTSAYNNTQVASPRAGNHRMLVQGRRGRRRGPDLVQHQRHRPRRLLRPRDLPRHQRQNPVRRQSRRDDHRGQPPVVRRRQLAPRRRHLQPHQRHAALRRRPLRRRQQRRHHRRQLRRLLALGRLTDHRLGQPTEQRLPGRHARRGIRHLQRTHGTADRLALPRQPLT